MKGNSLNCFFGFAVIADLRNFSEICRRLLINTRETASDKLKEQIYAIIFDFLVDTLETITKDIEPILFDFKHTGDGFLFLTCHNPLGKSDSVDSFLLLLDIYSSLKRTILKLNYEIIQLLWAKENHEIIRHNKHLSYIKNLFKDDSGAQGRPYIDFSVGAHCGVIFHKTYMNKKMFLGNTINEASRLQALSTTFTDYNLFFSKQISKSLEKAIKGSRLCTEISSKNLFKDLELIEIKGIGPSRVQTLEKSQMDYLKHRFSR